MTRNKGSEPPDRAGDLIYLGKQHYARIAPLGSRSEDMVAQHAIAAKRRGQIDEFVTDEDHESAVAGFVHTA